MLKTKAFGNAKSLNSVSGSIKPVKGFINNDKTYKSKDVMTFYKSLVNHS